MAVSHEYPCIYNLKQNLPQMKNKIKPLCHGMWNDQHSRCSNSSLVCSDCQIVDVNPKYIINYTNNNVSIYTLHMSQMNSHAPFIHCTVHVCNNSPQNLPVFRVLLEQRIQKVWVSKESKNRVNSIKWFFCEMSLHYLSDGGPTLIQGWQQVVSIIAEVHFIKTHHCHGCWMETSLEAFSQLQFFSGKLSIPVQYSQLDHHFDNVFDKLLSLLFVACLKVKSICILGDKKFLFSK